MARIVIVDDRVTNRRILARLAGELESSAEVQSFACPARALAWAEENEPDLVITDYKMPEMDGATFIRAFRRLPTCADVPVIVVTAYEDKAYRYGALNAGATDFLLSPVDHEEFRARVRNLLTLRRQQHLLKRRAAQLQANLENSNRLHRVALRESEEKLHLVINAVPAMISATNAENRYVFMNNFQAWTLGIDPSQAVNRPVALLMGTAYGTRSNALDASIFDDGRTLPAYEEDFVDATGERRVLLTTKSPLLDTAGHVTNVVTTAIDISDRKAAEIALEQQRNFLRAVIDLNPNYIFATDRGGRIALANRAFAAAHGSSPDRLVGTSHGACEPIPEEAAQFLADTARVLDDALVRLDVERQITEASGAQRWLQVSHVPLEQPGTRERQVLTVGTDVTALKEAERAMRDAKHAAELSDRSKSDFLANMSHELRTPLNAIIGFAEMIDSEVLGPVVIDKYREYASDIGQSAHHLLGVINDILDISKIEAGKIALQEEDLDLETIIASVERLVTERARLGEVTLESSVSTRLPLLRADPQRLKQVLLNLFSNAIKFTRPGGLVRVDAAVRRDGGIEMAVADNGIGMDESEIPVAFSRFGQVENALTRTHPGTGLGLPLATAFLTLHDATIDIVSRKGVGTTVTIGFPAERSIWREASTAE